MDTQELVAKITGKDEAARADAWLNAGPVGAPAVPALAPVMSAKEFEVARAAKRAIWKVVRHAGRPGAEGDAAAVSKELLAALKGQQDVGARRELVWMLSEVAGDEAVGPLAGLLADKELREDARAALQRIPGEKSMAALQSALASAPDEYKPALADSIRKRGGKAEGVKCLKLAPTKPTKVKPVGR